MPEVGNTGSSPLFPFIWHNAASGTLKNNEKKTKSGKSSERTRKTSFFSILRNDAANAVQDTEQTQHVYASGEAELTALLDEVHRSGDTLLKRPFPNEINRYKISVKNFMRYITQNGFSIEESEGILNRHKPQFKDRKKSEGTRRNKYTIITVIDQKLEQLAAGIMAGQTEQIKLLQRIDEINGLIVDLLR